MGPARHIEAASPFSFIGELNWDTWESSEALPETATPINVSRRVEMEDIDDEDWPKEPVPTEWLGTRSFCAHHRLPGSRRGRN